MENQVNKTKAPGERFPDLLGKDATGREVKLSDYPGKRTGGRSDRTSTLEKLLERATCVGFNRLQDEIRRKEERKK